MAESRDFIRFGDSNHRHWRLWRQDDRPVRVRPAKLLVARERVEAGGCAKIMQSFRLKITSSEFSVTHAADLIEYLETAARYEYIDLVNGSRAEGLTREELRALVEAFHVQTTLV